jgi:hypothetical protein
LRQNAHKMVAGIGEQLCAGGRLAVAKKIARAVQKTSRRIPQVRLGPTNDGEPAPPEPAPIDFRDRGAARQIQDLGDQSNEHRQPRDRRRKCP